MKKYVSFSGHGVDVAVNRADDLDRLSLEHFSSKNAPSTLDLGCGAGGHSVRMAEVGVHVTAIDKHNFSREFIALNDCLKGEGKLEFICGDMVEISQLLAGRRFTDAYIQRTLHYLKYDDALALLKDLHDIVDDSLFISVMGIKSEAGNDYLGNSVEVSNRFFKLSEESALKYSIAEPVCLYTEEEFVQLLETAGWKVKRCWQSAFGNIKVVCEI